MGMGKPMEQAPNLNKCMPALSDLATDVLAHNRQDTVENRLGPIIARKKPTFGFHSDGTLSSVSPAGTSYQERSLQEPVLFPLAWPHPVAQGAQAQTAWSVSGSEAAKDDSGRPTFLLCSVLADVNIHGSRKAKREGIPTKHSSIFLCL